MGSFSTRAVKSPWGERGWGDDAVAVAGPLGVGDLLRPGWARSDGIVTAKSRLSTTKTNRPVPTACPVSTGDYELRFRLWDAATGGNLVWGPQAFKARAAPASARSCPLSKAGWQKARCFELVVRAPKLTMKS